MLLDGLRMADVNAKENIIKYISIINISLNIIKYFIRFIKYKSNKIIDDYYNID